MFAKKYHTDEERLEAIKRNRKRACKRYYEKNAERLRKRRVEAYHKAHPNAEYYDMTPKES